MASEDALGLNSFCMQLPLWEEYQISLLYRSIFTKIVIVDCQKSLEIKQIDLLKSLIFLIITTLIKTEGMMTLANFELI